MASDLPNPYQCSVSFQDQQLTLDCKSQNGLSGDVAGSGANFSTVATLQDLENLKAELHAEHSAEIGTVSTAVCQIYSGLPHNVESLDTFCQNRGVDTRRTRTSQANQSYRLSK